MPATRPVGEPEQIQRDRWGLGVDGLEGDTGTSHWGGGAKDQPLEEKTLKEEENSCFPSLYQTSSRKSRKRENKAIKRGKAREDLSHGLR